MEILVLTSRVVWEDDKYVARIAGLNLEGVGNSVEQAQDDLIQQMRAWIEAQDGASGLEQLIRETDAVVYPILVLIAIEVRLLLSRAIQVNGAANPLLEPTGQIILKVPPFRMCNQTDIHGWVPKTFMSCETPVNCLAIKLARRGGSAMTAATRGLAWPSP